MNWYRPTPVHLCHPLKLEFMEMLVKLYCGQESLRRNGVAIIVNKRVWNAVSQSVSSVAQSCPTLCDPQHVRPPCPSQTPGVYSNSCPSSWWCHPAISSSVVPFSSCPKSFPASGSFPTSQFFASGGQSIGVPASASVLPMNTQDWSPLGCTGWIPLQLKRLSRDCHTDWSISNKYHTISLTYGILKNGTNELIYKTEKSHRCRKQTSLLLFVLLSNLTSLPPPKPVQPLTHINHFFFKKNSHSYPSCCVECSQPHFILFMSVSCLVCALSSVVALLRLETMFLLFYIPYTMVFRLNCLGRYLDSQLLLRCVHLRLLNYASSIFLPQVTATIGNCNHLPSAHMWMRTWVSWPCGSGGTA